MKEKINLAERLKFEKQKSLSETLVRGKECKEIRGEMNCYTDFKVWVLGTGYSISTINRDINRYELYELMEKEAKKIDIRSMKQSTGKKIMKAINRVFRLISECTKLNTVKINRELSRKIEKINYSIGVMSIS